MSTITCYVQRIKKHTQPSLLRTKIVYDVDECFLIRLSAGGLLVALAILALLVLHVSMRRYHKLAPLLQSVGRDVRRQ